MAPVNEATVMGNVIPFSAGLLESGWLADVDIVCENRNWKAHKLIVCVQSKWFERALLGNYHEAKTGIVTITSFKSEEIAVLLKFLYTGGIEVTPKFNKNYDNPFITYMRLFHMADYFEIPKLCDLVLQSLDDHTLALGKQLCRVPETEDHAKAQGNIVNVIVIDQLFVFIEELYGKYYRSGEYPGHAQTIKKYFRPSLFRLLMCCVNGPLRGPQFRALTHKYLLFGTEWGLFLTNMVGRRGFVEPQSAGEASGEHICATCGELVMGKDALADTFELVFGSKDQSWKVQCDNCFKLPFLVEWKEGVRSEQ